MCGGQNYPVCIVWGDCLQLRGSRNVWKDRCRDVSVGLLHRQKIHGGAHNSLLDEKERCKEVGEKKDGLQILAGFSEKIHV